MQLTLTELQARKEKFVAQMNAEFPDWDTAIFFDTVNHYYFTGTIQDGVLLILRRKEAGELRYGVRRSYERARIESPFCQGRNSGGAEIFPISNYRDVAKVVGENLGVTYWEGETATLIAQERIKKCFQISAVKFLDAAIKKTRAIKSAYELYWMKQSGARHQILLNERVPNLLREGMSEAEFVGEITREMYGLDYQGVTRFQHPMAEMAIGQIGFGTNALCPASFDGPGGSAGHSAAAPFGADGNRKLQRGDAVFVDIGFATNGYHTDKTQMYFFGDKIPEALVATHRFCLDIEARIAERLKPGAIPAQIYDEIIATLSPSDVRGFMGVDERHQVKFFGHGVGLKIDEYPVIARGFNDPLAENMVISLEPKKGVAGIGLAGVEDTYVVTPRGGECITGGGREIIRV